ncbi:2og-fe oxygenase [Colletotrichum plurivorum]|uniref:2og-fe oxygenase n=1 Tax=Colletotrichum plurivorum TaxID=2175906 RepID=A0A8H6JPB2_9PEZI|nr:2og-fe oxygenase [Colletotrichum plurivorum]
MTWPSKSFIPEFKQCQPTAEQLEYIDLVNLDLSEYEDPTTRRHLVRGLLDGVTTHGFLTISNHGIPEELYSSQVDIAHALLTIPTEEKKPYEATPEQDARGQYAGFKPSGVLSSRAGFHKTLDHYDIPAYNPANRVHPPLLQPHMDRVTELMRIMRHNVLQKLLVLVSMVLEVPEDRILSTHATTDTTEYLRYLLYSPRPTSCADNSNQYRDLYLGGHTDWGSFTLLFSQPVSSLQIKTSSGEWKWAKYIPGALIVNVGEALELLTGGLFKASIHRVVKPPADQETAKRIGVVYFAQPSNGQRLEPIDSPMLRRLGIDKPIDEKIYTMSEYFYARRHGYKRLDFGRGRPKPEACQARV